MIIMSELNPLQYILQNASGIITSKQVTEAGLHRSVLSKLVKDNELLWVSRGVYMKPAAWEDEMYLIQYRYCKGVFSHETALYLHGMSDRTPARFTMTFPRGYNASSLKDENLTVKRSGKELYALGIINLPSPSGNLIRAYDIERTLCDIVRGAGIGDISIINQAMKHYASSKNRDIQKLMAYAGKLRVKSKIQNYMEILL